MGRFVVVMPVVLIWMQIADADAKWELWGNWTGADLKEVCDQADPNDGLSSCLGYVLGTLDGIRLMKGSSGNAIKVCEVPHYVTTRQICRRPAALSCLKVRFLPPTRSL